MSRHSTTALWGEDRLTTWLAQRPETAGLLGDDAAFLPAGGPFAITVDSQREGVHFRADLPPSWLARRLMAVNLSDLAASGAVPRYGFLAIGAPRCFEHRTFFRALLRDCRKYGVTLAGGDLSSSTKINLTLTLLGERTPRGEFLRRDSAKAGDHLWLGGPIGESALGLALLEHDAGPGRPLRLPENLPKNLRQFARRALNRHLQPEAQLELGSWLARRKKPSAAIDLSDGLARDLHRLCAASRVGCLVDRSLLQTHARFHELALFASRDPEKVLIEGGEDYVLLFSLPPKSRPPKQFDCHRIGEFTSEPGVRLVNGSMQVPQLASNRLGFDHFGAD